MRTHTNTCKTSTLNRTCRKCWALANWAFHLYASPHCWCLVIDCGSAPEMVSSFRFHYPIRLRPKVLNIWKIGLKSIIFINYTFLFVQVVSRPPHSFQGAVWQMRNYRFMAIEMRSNSLYPYQCNRPPTISSI